MFNTMPYGGGLQSIQMLGIVNALKTGNPTFDAMLAMVLPILLSFFLSQGFVLAKLVWSFLLRKSGGNYAFYRRSIVYDTINSSSNLQTMNLDEDSYNGYLIKGIKLYVHSQCNIKLDDAEIELIDIHCSANDTMRRGYNGTTSVYGLLSSCHVVEKPTHQKWHDVGIFDGAPVQIYFYDSIHEKKDSGRNSENGGNARRIKLQLKSSGEKSIDKFVDTAYKWYTKEMEKNTNRNHRYLYDLKCFEKNSREYNSHQEVAWYSRFLLGEEKTFDSLFSKHKKSLLDLVDDFQQRKGNFGVVGFPYKFGLLLHGPPGTGKTSIIKALAKYTKRHIINIPLTRVETNQELMSVFFNKRYHVLGCNTAHLGFKNVIFVLEDVDAVSEVVSSRKNQSEENVMHVVPQDNFDKNMDNRNKVAWKRTDALSLAGLLNVLDGVVDTPGRMVIMTTNHPELLDPALIRPGRIDKKFELGYMVSEDVIDMLGHYCRTEISKDEKSRISKVLSGGGGSDGGGNVQVTPAEVEQLILEKKNVKDIVDSLESMAMIDGNTSNSTITVDTGSNSSIEQSSF